MQVTLLQLSRLFLMFFVLTSQIVAAPVVSPVSKLDSNATSPCQPYFTPQQISLSPFHQDAENLPLFFQFSAISDTHTQLKKILFCPFGEDIVSPCFDPEVCSISSRIPLPIPNALSSPFPTLSPKRYTFPLSSSAVLRHVLPTFALEEPTTQNLPANPSDPHHWLLYPKPTTDNASLTVTTSPPVFKQKKSQLNPMKPELSSDLVGFIRTQTALLRQTSKKLFNRQHRTENNAPINESTNQSTTASDSVDVSSPETSDIPSPETSKTTDDGFQEDEPDGTLYETDVEDNAANAPNPEWLPEGFSDLPDEEISELAVYYDGKFLKNVVAEFDNKVVRLFNSDVLYAPLSPLLSDPEVVFSRLSKTLPANSDMACKNRRLGNVCPYLSPKIIGVILDRSNYRLDLFIAPEYLLYSAKERNIVFTEPTSNEWSYSSRISSNLSGNRTQVIADVVNDQYLSRGPYNLYMNLAYNHNIDYQDYDSSYTGDFFLNNLNGNYEKERRQYMLGFIPAEGTQYTPSGNIFGYGLKTIDRLMKGQEGLIGTPIDITISVPSIVTYYVNNQIIYSRRYPTGIHAVDTSAFPNGSYMIRAVIENINGDSSTQSFPFSKSTADPIMGYPEYAFYLGMNRGETAEIYPKITGDFFATWNYAYRYSPKLALYFESGIQDNALTLGFGPGFYWRKRQYIRPSIAYDTKAGILYSITTQNYWKDISATFHASRVKQDVYDSDELYSANVNWDLKRYGSISMNYNNTDSFTYVYNARRQYAFPKSWKDPFKFRLQIGHGSDGTFLRLGTTKTLYKDDHQQALFTNNINHDTDAGPMSSASNLSYLFGKDYSPTVKVGASANVGEDSVSLNTSLAKRIRNNTIRLQGSLQQPYDGDLTFMYDVSLSRKDAFGWVVNKDSATFLGNMEHSTGVLVTVDGMANNKDIVVSALGKEYRVDAQGHSAFIPLEPYRPHQIMVDYRGTQAFSFTGLEDPVVLFPGNIAFVNVVAKPVYTLFANFACGDAPFAYKAIYSSVDSVVTDADGFASLELAYDDVLRVYGKANEGVTFTTSNLMPEDGFLYMDQISCSTGADIMNAAAKKADATMVFPDETNTDPSTSTSESSSVKNTAPAVMADNLTPNNTDPSPASPDSTSTAKRSLADKEDDMASDGTDLITIDSASTTQPAPAVTADD